MSRHFRSFISLIDNDAAACTFQTLGQYRAELVKTGKRMAVDSELECAELAAASRAVLEWWDKWLEGTPFDQTLEDAEWSVFYALRRAAIAAAEGTA